VESILFAVFDLFFLKKHRSHLATFQVHQVQHFGSKLSQGQSPFLAHQESASEENHL
jgi:hypothetical protein